MEKVYLTREGLEKQRKELEILVKENRPEAVHQLAVARAHGDLSENAEYDAAREKLGDIDRRIGDLQQKLSRVQIIDQEDMASDEARILSKVKLKNLTNGTVFEYTLVDPMQSNPSLKLISVQSPIGSGLLGKKVGDVVTIDVPSGQLNLRVEEINRSEGL
jgi:transcription elongation factor GreA